MSSDQTGTTTVAIDRAAKRRLEDLRPYNSITWREFSQELADVYEDYRRDQGGDSSR